jgi:mono/diheme cytochrome c family protein
MIQMQTKTFIITALLAFALVFQACNKGPEHPGYEFMPDMYRSSSYETYSANPNFADGMTARMPVKGTVPRGFTPYPFENTNEGYEAAGVHFTNPLEASKANIEKGKKLYSTFCTPCHGDDGTGQGKLVQLDKFPPPPSFKTQLLELPEGKMFHSITYGRNMMGPHAAQLTMEERWQVVHYIKELQAPLNLP